MNRVSIILALVATALLCGCAGVFDQDAALAVAPYHIEDSGRIVIDVEVNGQGPYNFALDTAASISVIFDKPREELVLEPLADRAVVIHGAVGSGRFPLLTIDRIEFGQERWYSARVALLPAANATSDGIDGILGIDFLRRYAVGFSRGDRVIRLYAPELVRRRAYQGWSVIPLESERIGEHGASLFFFDIDINGRKIRAMFDLGSGLNVINWPASIHLGFPPPAYGLRKRGKIQGALQTSPNAVVLEATKVSTAGVQWRNERFYVTDLHIFDKLGLADSSAAILGAGLFTQRDFVIDFVGERLLVNVSMRESIGQASGGRAALHPPIAKKPLYTTNNTPAGCPL